MRDFDGSLINSFPQFSEDLRTWLDDDGPAVPLLLHPAVTPGPQPAFGVSLQHHHPSYHLPQLQVELLHVVIPQKNLMGRFH